MDVIVASADQSSRVSTPAQRHVGPGFPGTDAAGIDPSYLARRALAVALPTALGILGDREAAEDTAQEVAITALRRASSLRDIDKLDAWLHRIAVRAALKEARRGVQRRSPELTSLAVDAVERVDVELGETCALLGVLPSRQRAAMVLRYVHDLTDDQIARALSCRVGTVRSLLSRGRASLRVALENDPDFRRHDEQHH